MAIKREITTSEAFINNVNEKFDTKLTNKATPLELLKAFRKADENIGYEITDEKVVELVNGEAPTPGGLQPVEGLLSIWVNTYPNKQSYVVGDMFDPTGLTITGSFANGEMRSLIPNKEYMLGTSTDDLYEVSNTSIALQEKDVNIKAFAKVNEVDYVTSSDFALSMTDQSGNTYIKNILVTKNMNKTQYVIGEELSLTGLQTELLYSNNAEVFVDSNDLNDYFDYTIPALTEAGDFNLMLSLKDGINKIGLLPTNIPYSVYEVKPEPSLNRYEYVAPYNRVFAGPNYASHNYDLNNDVIGGSITKIMTDGTTENVPFSTEYLNCSLQGYMFQDGQTEIVTLSDLNDNFIGNYEVTYYSDAIISNIDTYEIGPQKHVGDNATLADVAIYITFMHNTYGTEVTVVPIPDYCTMSINNPLVLGENEYTISYNDIDSGLSGVSDTAIINAYEPEL